MAPSVGAAPTWSELTVRRITDLPRWNKMVPSGGNAPLASSRLIYATGLQPADRSARDTRYCSALEPPEGGNLVAVSIFKLSRCRFYGNDFAC